MAGYWLIGAAAFLILAFFLLYETRKDHIVAYVPQNVQMYAHVHADTIPSPAIPQLVSYASGVFGLDASFLQRVFDHSEEVAIVSLGEINPRTIIYAYAPGSEHLIFDTEQNIHSQSIDEKIYVYSFGDDFSFLTQADKDNNLSSVLDSLDKHSKQSIIKLYLSRTGKSMLSGLELQDNGQDYLAYVLEEGNYISFHTNTESSSEKSTIYDISSSVFQYSGDNARDFALHWLAQDDQVLKEFESLLLSSYNVEAEKIMQTLTGMGAVKWHLALFENGRWGIVFDDSQNRDQSEESLEALTRIFMAPYYETTKEHILRDGTSLIEIVADPLSVEFFESKAILDENIEVDVMTTQSHDGLQPMFLKYNNRWYWATESESLNELVRYYQMPQVSKCANSENETLIFDASLVPAQLRMDSGRFIFNIQNTNSLVSGCLLP